MELSDTIWSAVTRLLLTKGLLPFSSPSGWRRMLVPLVQLRDVQIRLFALFSIAAGVLMLWLT